RGGRDPRRRQRRGGRRGGAECGDRAGAGAAGRGRTRRRGRTYDLEPDRTRLKAMVSPMDEGAPTAYQVLDAGVPVYSSDGEQVGTVDHVVAAPAEDIFHGLVIRTSSSAGSPSAGQRF